MKIKFGDLINVTLAPAVLAHFEYNRQIKRSDKEAGGQLFAHIEGDSWVVVLASGPRKSDWRHRFGFRPDRKRERAEIEEYFEAGLHYVGDWHTHPEPSPSPSSQDVESMNELVQKSQHELIGFLMVIVGQSDWPGGLYVSLHTRCNFVIDSEFEDRSAS